MKEIFIKYNPYKVETEIKVDGKGIDPNSSLNVDEKRLQEWIEDLPQILIDEFNTKLFKIKFKGTNLDYEDLVSVSKDANKKGIQIICEHIPTKEVNDKEKHIREIFEMIKQGPFDELKQGDIFNSFKKVLSFEFEVDVVASTSAGKSTLINALIGKKLMPSKQEACTSTITKIKDQDIRVFRATAYNYEAEVQGVYPNLDYDTMVELNNNNDISIIEVEGDIPFVDSKENKLVLVDTPNLNNYRDTDHKTATYRMMGESSKTLVLYIY